MSHHFKYVVELSSTKAFLTSPPLTHRHSVKNGYFQLNRVNLGFQTNLRQKAVQYIFNKLYSCKLIFVSWTKSLDISIFLFHVQNYGKNFIHLSLIYLYKFSIKVLPFDVLEVSSFFRAKYLHYTYWDDYGMTSPDLPAKNKITICQKRLEIKSEC